MVTEARCAGGDERSDAAARSAPAEEAGVDTDAPKGADALGGGALVIKAAGALTSRWAALVCIASCWRDGGEQLLLHVMSVCCHGLHGIGRAASTQDAYAHLKARCGAANMMQDASSAQGMAVPETGLKAKVYTCS